MPLSYPLYDPDVKERKLAFPGEYDYEVYAAEEAHILHAGFGLTAYFTILDNGAETRGAMRFVYGKQQKELKAFLENIGLTYDPKPEKEDLIRKRGRAIFDVQKGFSEHILPGFVVVEFKEPVAQR